MEQKTEKRTVEGDCLILSLAGVAVIGIFISIAAMVFTLWILGVF